jgi:hypothetical protein
MNRLRRTDPISSHFPEFAVVRYRNPLPRMVDHNPIDGRFIGIVAGKAVLGIDPVNAYEDLINIDMFHGLRCQRAD